MNRQNSDEIRDGALLRALALMMEALDTLDGFDGAPEAAAHLDMAIAGLTRELTTVSH